MPSNPKLLAEETASPDSTFVDGGLFVHRKGVIEILSSILELGGLNFHEDELTMAPTSVAMPTPERESVYAFRCGAVVLSVEKVRQDLRIR